MKNSDTKKIPPNLGNEIDIASLSYFLKAYLYCFAAFGLLLFISNGLLGLLIAAVISLPMAFLISHITNKTGHKVSKLFYGGKEPNWTTQERFQGTINQVMHLKREKQFPQAFQKVNEILKEEPKFAEALFLKAQILWEGYETAGGAIRYLDKAKNFTSPDGHLRRWICSYKDGICKTIENKKQLERRESQR